MDKPAPIVRMSVVFAVPGTPSTKTCPLENRAERHNLSASLCPKTTFSIWAVASLYRLTMACESSEFESGCDIYLRSPEVG
jgi:hypothetical protein